MANRALDEVGVRAVFEGFRQYLDQVNQFERANARAAASVRKTATQTASAGAVAGQLQTQLKGNTRQALSFAAGMVGAQSGILAVRAGLAGTVGAAIAFEDSFAGIRKTVDATEEEFERLEKANRNLAKSVPQSVNAINAIGELGGALGVEGVDNIIKFEKVTADLAETTDLTAESAATALAQLSNIFQTPIDQVDRMGSALVELGNNGASTEAEIVNFALRIAAAGKIAGLTVAEVEGIGSAFASVGVQAEAGGTAVQKILIAITQAAALGGAKLAQFAAVAGLSAGEFQKLFKDDPAEAFTRFVEGLGKSGDEIFAILDDLEEADVRTVRSFASVAQAGELLRTSVETGSRAFAENNALQIEAEKRYATTASQLKILRNNVEDAGISLSEGLLPPIVSVSGGMVELLDGARDFAPVFKAAGTAVIFFGGTLLALKLGSVAASLGTVTLNAKSLQAVMASPIGKAGLVAGIVAIADIASRAGLGQGLFDLFSNSDEKAKIAAASLTEYNKELERLARLQEALGTADGLDSFLDSQVVALERFRLELKETRKDIDNSLFNIPNSEGLGEALVNLPGIGAAGRAIGVKVGSKDAEARAAADQVVAEIQRTKDLIESAIASDADPVSALIRFRIRLEEESPIENTALQAEIDAKQRELEAATGLLPKIELRLELETLIKSQSDNDEFRREVDAFLKEQQNTLEAKDLSIDLEVVAKAGVKFKDGGIEFVSALDAGAVASDAFRDSNVATAAQLGEFANALKNVSSLVSDGVDSVASALQLQIATLEQQRRAAEASGTSTERLDAQIASLEKTLASHNATAEIAALQIELFGARAFEAMTSAGRTADEATALVNSLGSTLAKLPEKERIEIAAILPTLEMNRLLNFLALIERGVTLRVALQTATLKETSINPTGGFLGGTFGGAFGDQAINEHNARVAEQDFLDKVFAGAATAGSDAVAGATENFNNFVPAADKAADGVSYLQKVLNAAADGVLTLGEALELSLSDAQVVTLELAVAQNAVAAAAFRDRIELQKLSVIFTGMTPEAVQLALALGQIDAHLKETGQSINEFIHDTATTALEGFQSAFDAIFNKPTKETLNLQLKLARLELTRAQRKGSGATDKQLEGIDKEIDQVKDLLALRQKEVEILQLETALRDASLKTDRDVIDQAELLAVAIEGASKEVVKFEGAAFFDALAHINAGNAANEAAAALRGLAGATTSSGSALSLADALIALDAAGIHDPSQIPSAANGAVFFKPTLAVVGDNKREPEMVGTSSLMRSIFATAPPVQQTVTRRGDTIFSPTLVEQGMDAAAMRRQFHGWVDEMFSGSSSRTHRGGSPLSSGVG